MAVRGIFGLLKKESLENLISLADQYEVRDFSFDDPSIVLRHYEDAVDTEILAFVAAMISFGRREQFLPIINTIISDMDAAGGARAYILHECYKKDCAAGGGATFYRFYKISDYWTLCARLKAIVVEWGGLGEAVRAAYKKNGGLLCDLIGGLFFDCKMVAKTKSSPKKRINMFLRWMVRGGVVDLGLWTWADKRDLLIPLDTHVLTEAKRLGLLLKNDPPTMKTCQKLTNLMKEAFPLDPARADFVLFGSGVGSKAKK